MLTDGSINKKKYVQIILKIGQLVKRPRNKICYKIVSFRIYFASKVLVQLRNIFEKLFFADHV